jgi:hypothetical protein
MQKIILTTALALLTLTGHAETYDSGLLAAQAAASALANAGAAPTRMCSNKRPDKDATRVMMEGQTEAGTVALEVVKQGAAWKVRDAQNPQGWTAGECKYFGTDAALYP